MKPISLFSGGVLQIGSINVSICSWVASENDGKQLFNWISIWFSPTTGVDWFFL